MENKMELYKYWVMEINQTKWEEVLSEVEQCLENINIYDYL